MADRGLGVIWALGSLSTITNFGSYKMQSHDYDRSAEKYQLKDEGGNTVGTKYYEFIEKATFRYIPSATSGSAVVVTLPQIGDGFSITDSAAQQVTGSGWIVEKAGYKRTNGSALGADVDAWRYANITF